MAECFDTLEPDRAAAVRGAYLDGLSYADLALRHDVPLNTMLSFFAGQGDWQHSCGYKSMHPGGANFVLGDNSTRFISDTIDFQLFNALGTRNGEEVLDTSQL